MASRSAGVARSGGELVIFTQCFDLLRWLLPMAEHLPKSQRFVVTQRLLNAALDFQESLFAANAQREHRRLHRLEDADAQLNTLRLYLRLAQQMGWLSLGQFEHASRMVAGLGKLLGGWIRQTRAALPEPHQTDDNLP